MKALVTGGAGFIGSNLVQYLIKNGVSIRVLDDLSTGYQKNVKDLDVEFVFGDVCDSSLVKKAIEGVDVVFHLAASVGRQKSLNDPRRDAEVNMIGTTNVLEAARQAGVRRIVNTSSAAIFGELLTMPIAEDHPLNPDSPYGVSKLAAEKQALCFSDLYDLTVVCLRYFNVYGINQRFDAYGNVIPIFADRLYKRLPITIYGDGEQTRDFINVTDVVMANYLAATVAKQSGVYNIGSGLSITINHLAKMMKDISGSDSSIEYAPMRPADVRHCRAEISKAKNNLKFSPNVKIEDGLVEYLKWFEEDRKVIE
ncbi:MAG: NAD-dependent epimerase/dehydratase family protein [Anaerolineaceae bacterium]|nr:NAD-dependent epimerase/dehydratase family protein [Anaerolineaceae bacterium]